MLLEGAINGHALNEAELNGTPGEPVFMAEAVAEIRVDLPGSGQVHGNIFASTAVAGIALTPSASVTVNPSSEGLAGVTLTLPGSVTLSSSGQGIADIALSGSADPTINPSSDGVAELALALSAYITVSGGTGSGGVAGIRVAPRLDPYVWTYLYNAGLAEIALGGLVNPRYRPPLPTTFYPANETLLLGPDARRGQVAPDADTMPVRPGRHRVEVPEEETP